MGERVSTRGTVLIAGAANLLVGAIKLDGGDLGGLERHAGGDRSLGGRHPQPGAAARIAAPGRAARRPRHPFGYGQERYFWSLLAAFGIFIAGAGFSVFEGVLALRHGNSESPLIAYVVLAVSAVAEGTSLVRVIIQFRSEARREDMGLLDRVRSSPDTTVKTALFEDSAAMVGLALAALGLLLRQLTGSPVWDGAASIAIGGLLVVVAVRLGLDSRDYLIGHAAAPRELAVIRAEIEQAPGVDALLRLRTMYLGPDHLIVAAQVAFDDEISADQAEDIADRVDRRLSTGCRSVPHVFLDPTQASSGSQGVKT